MAQHVEQEPSREPSSSGGSSWLRISPKPAFTPVSRSGTRARFAGGSITSSCSAISPSIAVAAVSRRSDRGRFESGAIAVCCSDSESDVPSEDAASKTEGKAAENIVVHAEPMRRSHVDAIHSSLKFAVLI